MNYFSQFFFIFSIVDKFYFISCEQNNRFGGSYVYENTRPSELGNVPEFDPQGYVFFCLCMGRFGNQMEHFIGGMAFAKSLNRTLVLPPLRTYRNVRFTEWFNFNDMGRFHKVVLAEDFMEYIAPNYWPEGSRIGFCWKQPGSQESDCNMKEGNPFGPFWDGLNVNFDSSLIYHLSYNDNDLSNWNIMFPSSKYPVLAFRGAPASFPANPDHWYLQQFIVFSERIQNDTDTYISQNIKNQPYLGIHLRNGPDWENVCSRVAGLNDFMASPQCLHNSDKTITHAMCLPSKVEIFRLIKKFVLKYGLKNIFIATDKNPMIDELNEYLKNQTVKIFHADPWLPIIDISILIKADYFIGNCISSFTSFVKRSRDVQGKRTHFWGM